MKFWDCHISKYPAKPVKAAGRNMQPYACPKHYGPLAFRNSYPKFSPLNIFYFVSGLLARTCVRSSFPSYRGMYMITITHCLPRVAGEIGSYTLGSVNIAIIISVGMVAKTFFASSLVLFPTLSIVHLPDIFRAMGDPSDLGNTTSMCFSSCSL